MSEITLSQIIEDVRRLNESRTDVDLNCSFWCEKHDNINICVGATDRASEWRRSRVFYTNPEAEFADAEYRFQLSQARQWIANLPSAEARFRDQAVRRLTEFSDTLPNTGPMAELWDILRQSILDEAKRISENALMPPSQAAE